MSLSCTLNQSPLYHILVCKMLDSQLHIEKPVRLIGLQVMQGIGFKLLVRSAFLLFVFWDLEKVVWSCSFKEGIHALFSGWVYLTTWTHRYTGSFFSLYISFGRAQFLIRVSRTLLRWVFVVVVGWLEGFFWSCFLLHCRVVLATAINFKLQEVKKRSCLLPRSKSCCLIQGLLLVSTGGQHSFVVCLSSTISKCPLRPIINVCLAQLTTCSGLFFFPHSISRNKLSYL